MRSMAVCALLVLSVTVLRAEEGYTELFDGKTLNGWKAGENPGSFSVVDGAIVAKGQPVAHLFYDGDQKPFTNFELKIDLWTEPNSNGGVIFGCQFQEKGWVKSGFEAQVNNSYKKDPKMSGSLYAVKNVTESPAKDQEWYTMVVRVEGKKITITTNGKVTAEYTEPDGQQPGKDFRRVIEPGTIALQAHDPNSIVKYKNIRIKKL